MLFRSVLVSAGLVLSLAAHAFAGDHTAANETIWPSQNDVAQTAGNGKKLLENQWAKPAAVFTSNNHTLTGLTVPGTSGTLNIDVALGTALIAGRHVTIPAATTVTAAASNTNHVFLKLTRDGSSLATGVSFEVNITGVPPADSTPIATLTAGASTITATTSTRIFPKTSTMLTSGTTWDVPAGISYVCAEVFGASGGGGGGSEGGAANLGANGTAGGTTTFDTLSAGGGSGGRGGGQTSSGANHGTATVGAVLMTGGGRPGGSGGGGGGGADAGSMGGFGGYSRGCLTVTPGGTVTYAIGSAGSGGAGGTGGAGVDGIVGDAGLAGVIAIHY